MPLNISCEDNSVATLEELIEHLFEAKIDTSNLDSCVAAAPMLKRLSNNRTFLADMVCSELRNYRTLQESNSYSAQVFMLYPPQRRGQGFFIRACFWPSDADQIVKTSGTDPFFYYKPHDHNFNFLTVGYHGPGYWSDYYEYEYDDCVGYRGENASIRFIERSRLEAGKVMLYRAFTDIHNQLPADSFSVSLNIMENSMRASLMDQYAFDVATGQVSGLINRMSSAALFTVAASIGSDENKDVLATIARRHPLERVRLAAFHALASAESDPAEAIRIWNMVRADDPMFLREWRKVRTLELETLMAN